MSLLQAVSVTRAGQFQYNFRISRAAVARATQLLASSLLDTDKISLVIASLFCPLDSPRYPFSHVLIKPRLFLVIFVYDYNRVRYFHIIICYLTHIHLYATVFYLIYSDAQMPL